MLKLQYTETGLFMELVTGSLDIVVAQRVLLAIRAGQCLHVQPSSAAFLLPADAKGVEQLAFVLRLEQQLAVTIVPVDEEFVEICVTGTWIAENANAEEGIFLTTLGERTEFWIHELWQLTQSAISYLA
jgi:hypothetical protein